MLVLAGCAKPCFDDGLAQGGCPEAAGDATEGKGTESETADGTMSGTAADADGSADASDTLDESGGGSGGGYDCPELDKVLVPQVPTFQLVLDQSGSMDEDFGGTTRWEAVQSALVGNNGVVTALQSEIRFGVSLYHNDMTCPNVQQLAAQLDAQDEITTLLQGEMPAGDTPTGEALVEVTDALLADTWEGEKVLVLATDGEPDTCNNPEPITDQEIAMARMVATDAVTSAFDKGIRTFVISVGAEIAEEHLQALANAGVGNGASDPDAPFYVADDTDGLIGAFNEIIAGIRPCTFDLDMPLPSEVADTCTVTVNDTAVPYDDPDGWTPKTESQIELQGAACDQIQMGVVVIAMTCTCGK